jgi:pyruvate ferredoxin oxidoreductase alpha subunit
MAKYISLTGNDAGAHALRQACPDVAPAYPITPQTELMHKFAEFVANGKVDTEMILVESEHSAMSAAIGASAAGGRVFTATSANGLALMWEMLYIAASCRLPIVMPVVNRALSGPINIHCDHSDAMGARDSGWIQLFCENGQEVYDTTIQAFRIAEHPDVKLPVMICFDGFVISHTNEPVALLEDKQVAGFVGEYKPAQSLLDIEKPFTVGPLALPDWYFEFKRQQVEAMRKAMPVIASVGAEFGKLSGRSYSFLETYMMDDADVAILALGSTCGTAMGSIDQARAKGIKAGLVKLRAFRPFPVEQVRKALSGVKGIGVMDRCISFGLEGGPVFHEVRSALYGVSSAPVLPFVYGLGGRDIREDQILNAVESVNEAAKSGVKDKEVEFIGLRD